MVHKLSKNGFLYPAPLYKPQDLFWHTKVYNPQGICAKIQYSFCHAMQLTSRPRWKIFISGACINFANTVPCSGHAYATYKQIRQTATLAAHHHHHQHSVTSDIGRLRKTFTYLLNSDVTVTIYKQIQMNQLEKNYLLCHMYFVMYVNSSFFIPHHLLVFNFTSIQHLHAYYT